MSEQWINDSKLREAAARFFATVRSTRCESIEEVTALIETNRGFRSTGSIVFAYDADIQQQLNVLVQRCLKLLGTQTGHEKDIEELAWKHVAMDVSDDTVVKAFITALHTTSTISFSYVAPNYAVRFSDGIREITVGPVQACLAEDTATKVNKRNENPHWYISSGTHPGTKYQDDKTIFELPAVCWYVDVVASKGNIEEETLWLVNIALSLLRFIGRYF